MDINTKTSNLKAMSKAMSSIAEAILPALILF